MAVAPVPILPHVLEAVCSTGVVALEAPPVSNIPVPPGLEVYCSSYFYGMCLVTPLGCSLLPL